MKTVFKAVYEVSENTYLSPCICTPFNINVSASKVDIGTLWNDKDIIGYYTGFKTLEEANHFAIANTLYTKNRFVNKILKLQVTDYHTFSTVGKCFSLKNEGVLFEKAEKILKVYKIKYNEE